MTVTPTLTNTPVNNQALAINNIVIYPNPYNPDKGDLNVKFELTQPGKLIRVRIYTSGFRMIKKITQTGNFTAGGNIINIENEYLSRLANGTYYIILSVINNTGITENSKPEILIILR
jgi:hypothetical protein